MENIDKNLWEKFQNSNKFVVGERNMEPQILEQFLSYWKLGNHHPKLEESWLL